MKILLVNAALSSQTEVAALHEWIFRSFPGIRKYIKADLNDRNILPCNACMSCQIKKPGICIIKDDMQELLPAYINSDIVVFLTPLFCGGYPSKLKMFIDRLCPVLTACFEKRNGETWHIPRYEKRPVMIGIGLSDNSGTSETVFYELFSRNMSQLNIGKYYCQNIRKGMTHDELHMLFHESFNKVGVCI